MVNLAVLEGGLCTDIQSAEKAWQCWLAQGQAGLMDTWDAMELHCAADCFLPWRVNMLFYSVTYISTNRNPGT